MVCIDDNIRPSECSAAEEQASTDPKEKSNVTSDAHKARTCRNDTNNRMTARMRVRIVYLFFFLFQTWFYCFLLGNVLSGRYQSQSPLVLWCRCLYV